MKPDFYAESNQEPRPNQALQRTAPAVTLAAPPPAPAQPSRQPPQSLSLGSFGDARVSLVKYALLLLLMPTFPLCAGEQWPRVNYAEVRAFAWPNKPTEAVILPGMRVKPGAIDKEGERLTPAQVARLQAAITGRHPSFGPVFCYSPHNAFVFYDAAHKPVAFVELCFTCVMFRAEPKGTANGYDWLALAGIFDELKLPMGEYPHSKAFKKWFTRNSK